MQWQKIILLLSLVFLATGSQHCTCRPKTVCGWAYLTRSRAECQLPGGRGGFCCPQVVPRTGTRHGLLSDRTPSNSEGSENDSIVGPAVAIFSPVLLGSRKSETSSVDTINDTTVHTSHTTTTDINHDITTEVTGIAEDEDIDTQEETSGYRLYKKAKKEFDDLNIYARKLLQG